MFLLLGLTTAALGIWAVGWKGESGSGLRTGSGATYINALGGPRIYPKLLGGSILALAAFFFYLGWLTRT